jgi:hypothetical protein
MTGPSGVLALRAVRRVVVEGPRRARASPALPATARGAQSMHVPSSPARARLRLGAVRAVGAPSGADEATGP